LGNARGSQSPLAASSAGNYIRSVLGRARSLRLSLILVLLGTTGCTAVAYRIGVPFFYRRADLPETQIVRDLPYRTGPGADREKNRLDLYRPTGRGWPVMVFIHGGGWTSGDKSFRAGGADIYANIGRFYAARGIGVAVISYRLQPDVAWPAQLADVAHAVAWVHTNVARYGGDPDTIVLAGHSAGGQFAARIALDPGPLATLGVDRRVVKGFVSVSGAGLDLTDEESWRLGQPRGYYETRFKNGDAGDGWMREASPVRFVDRTSPPGLVMWAEGDPADLRRQGQVLASALRSAGVPTTNAVVPGSSHTRIVLTLSRGDTVSARAILAFVRSVETARVTRPGAATAVGSARR
jgi:acetyl esterase/lipase